MSYDFFPHKNILDLNVYNLQNACAAFISSVTSDEQQLAVLGEVTTIFKIYANNMHWDTLSMPEIQVMNFLSLTHLTPRFWNWPQSFWEICGPQQ
jgi:hypothetical protein